MKDMLKKIAISLFLLPLVGGLMLSTATTKTRAAADDFDAAAVYKAKCAMCHTGNAGKFFDPTGKTDDVLVNTILTGKKGEKPPFMPAFSEKGITADQAKALVTYMKSLKQ